MRASVARRTTRLLAVVGLFLLVAMASLDLPVARGREDLGHPLAEATVDPSNRADALAFYHANYVIAAPATPDWTGSIASCLPGTVSERYRSLVLRRINYFRAMAGVPATITLNPDYNRKAQAAALMMSAGDRLDHFPAPSWPCYSLDGSEGAGHSNLSRQAGWEAIDDYMRDPGTVNYAVGHRKWLLYPQTQQMGTGDVPATAGRWPTNALWVGDPNYWGPRPAVREPAGFVAWPPRGYSPYTVVYPRWSFAYPSADFSRATVSMRRADGSPVPLTIEPLSTTAGENTLVWRPYNRDSFQQWPRPAADEVYSVSVQNVILQGASVDFMYPVIIIDDVLVSSNPRPERSFLPAVQR